MNRQEMDRAEEYWLRGDPLEAGRMLIDALAASERPKWALSVLKQVTADLATPIDAIEELQMIGEFPERASSGKAIFSKIRRLTIALEARQFLSNEDQFAVCVLYLAENVAKVVYNSTHPMDEFDEDSGWWVVSCARDCVNRRANREFETSVWQKLRGTQKGDADH